MQILKAVELFKNIENINNIDFEKNSNINIDFSNINFIDLKAVRTLLNIQKVAVLNKKTLSLSNVNPEVHQILEVTGLNKAFTKNITNPITKA